MKTILLILSLTLTACAGLETRGPINWGPAVGFANSMNEPTQVQRQTSCYSTPRYSYDGTYLGTQTQCR